MARPSRTPRDYLQGKQIKQRLLGAIRDYRTRFASEKQYDIPDEHLQPFVDDLDALIDTLTIALDVKYQLTGWDFTLLLGRCIEDTMGLGRDTPLTRVDLSEACMGEGPYGKTLREQVGYQQLSFNNAQQTLEERTVIDFEDYFKQQPTIDALCRSAVLNVPDITPQEVEQQLFLGKRIIPYLLLAKHEQQFKEIFYAALEQINQPNPPQR